MANETELHNSDDLLVEAVAPEQTGPHLWQFRPRQEPKWGTVTKQGLVVGRAPRQQVINPDELYFLATLGCGIRDLATWYGVSESTIKYNFSDYILKAKEETKQRLRQAQIKSALAGNAAMLIWLGKNMLGQSDQPTVTDANRILPWTDE